MHKDEAARGFAILANPNRVKICKMLYNKGDLSYDELHAIFEDEKALKDDLRILIEGGFVVVIDKYSLRKGYVDSLMNFIKTPCGCTK